MAAFSPFPPANGYSPHTKKRKMNLSLACIADTYIKCHQPGRVPLTNITWHHSNRGGHGILQYHCHDVALDVIQMGTSKRRYNQVRLVEVPDSAIPEVLAENREKADLDPLLSNFDAIRHNNPVNGSNIAT